MKRRDRIEVLPSAKRLIRSLRDIGYDLNHAVADLVDNSIAAKAGRIEVTLRFDGEDSWIRVADDGNGMSRAEITEAMRFGSEREYDTSDLGKFGLGLKTASLSQCRCLTVASRVSESSRRIEARQWDMDEIARTNSWHVFNLGPPDRPERLTEPLCFRTGTVVLWDRLDRVLSYRIPWGKRAKAGLFTSAEELELHLGMVFHRFLAGEARRRKRLHIKINDTQIEPWDPYARSEADTREIWSEEFEVRTDKGTGLVRGTGYVLPRQDRFSSRQAFDRMSGPAKWNRQQGFYIYRGDRLIQSGGWSRMRTADEHTKLARVALEFQPDLDDAFSINVTKARVGLPRSLRDQIEPFIDRLVKEARAVYSAKSSMSRGTSAGGGRGGRGASGGTGGSGSGGSGGRDGKGTSGRGGSGTNEATTVSTGEAGTVIRKAAKEARAAGALSRVEKKVRQKHPEVADALGW